MTTGWSSSRAGGDAYERALSEGGLFKYDDPLRGRLPPDGGVGPLRPGYRRDGPEVSGPPGGIGGREVVLFIRPSSEPVR